MHPEGIHPTDLLDSAFNPTPSSSSPLMPWGESQYSGTIEPLIVGTIQVTEIA
jgi:hypothetical protein